MLTLNSLPAERRRGCLFAEKFESNDSIIRNNGSIAGSVASFQPIVGVKTVIAKLKVADTVSNTVKINSGNTITITAGNVFGSFTTGTAIAADDIQVDDYTKFEFVKMFTVELTAQELLDYENGVTFSYMNEALVHLPFTAVTHDPDNNRTLDLKGNANLTFGDGVTSTTFPSKLKERGYETDGGDSLRFAGNPFETTDEDFTFAAVIRPSTFTPTSQAIVSIEDGIISSGLLLIGTNKYSFFSGTSIVAHEAKFTNQPNNTNQLSVVIGFYDSTANVTSIYVNGIKGTNASTPVPPSFTNNMTMQAFVRGNFIAQPAAIGTKLLEIVMWKKALTPIQIQDLTFNSLSLHNQV